MIFEPMEGAVLLKIIQNTFEEDSYIVIDSNGSKYSNGDRVELWSNDGVKEIDLDDEDYAVVMASSIAGAYKDGE